MAGAAAVILPACGNDTGGGVTDANDLVNLGATLTPNFNQVPILLGQQKGFFFDEQIELVKIGVTTAGVPAALVGGGLDHAMFGVPGAFTSMIAQGEELILACLVGVQNPNTLVVSQTWIDQTGVGPDASLEDRLLSLKGAKLASTVPGSAIDQTVAFLVSRVGLQAGADYENVHLQEISTFVPALERGDVDGFLASAPIPETAIVQGLAQPFLVLQRGEVPELAGMAWYSLWGYRESFAADSDRTERLVRGFWQTLRYLDTNGDEAKETMKTTVFSGLDPAVFDLAWETAKPTWPRDPFFTDDAVQKAIDLHNFGAEEGAALDKAPSELYTNEYIEAVQGDFA